MTRAPQHCLTLADLGEAGLREVLRQAATLKAERGRHPKPLAGKSVAVLLEKHSTRTRLSFEVGIAELGAHPLVLAAEQTQLGRGEPLDDTARMLSRFVHAVVYRTSAHARLETLAATGTIPVINGLSDDFHPCQVLADLLTIQENFGTLDVPVTWIGDGNNMARSWVVAAGLLGFPLTLATPAGFDVDPAFVTEAGRGHVRHLRSPLEAAKGARVVTTDVWTSMGQEEEKARREEAFQDFCVNDAIMSAAPPEAIFLHCLPAHRGEEVAASVIDGPQSRVWDEAENRLHAQKGLLVHLMSG